jgi:hypothetical protein
MTRPIPPRTLLGAKLVFLCIVTVLVPVLAEIALMAADGFSFESMIALALQAAIAQLFWVILAMSFAALTPGLAQFFLLCGATPVAIALGFFLTALTGSALGWDLMSTSAAFEQARAGAAFVVLTIIAAAALLLVLYHTRSRTRSVMVGAAILLLALSLPELLQRPVGSDGSALPQWAATLPQPTMDPASIRIERTPSTDDAVLRGRVTLAGMPSHWSASVTVKSAHMDIGDRVSRSSSFSVLGDYPPPPSVSADGQEAPSTETAVKYILRVDTVEGMPASDSQLVKLIGLRRSEIDDLSTKPVHYRGTLTLSFSERTVAAVLPLRRGSSFNDGTTSMKVMAFDVIEGQRVSMTLRESSAKTIGHEESLFRFEIFLRNPISREAVYGEYGFGREDFSPSILWPVAVVTEGRPLGFRVNATRFLLPSHSSNVSMRLDPAWLDRAELVIVRVRHAGSLERILDIPAVPLTAASLQ